MNGVVIVGFAPQAAPEERRRALRALGHAGEPDPGCRWFGPDLVCVEPREPGADPRGLPGVARAVALAPGQHLATGAGPFAWDVPALRPEERPLVIAGPCSVEGRAQVLEAAERVAEAGATALRGGCFKARSTPYAFGGLGERGLELLAEARARTGLPVVVEALDVAQLDVIAPYADALQVGSRSMHCPSLLFAAGAHRSGLPVLLKRGLAATVDELLLAAEYVLLGRLAAGRTQAGLILCERGLRSFERSTRFTLDVAAIPVLRRRCPLPLVVDPSHAAGDRALVPPLALAAMAAGADGLLVEVHPDPDRAWCDGPQSLTPAAFHDLMRALGAAPGPHRPPKAAGGRSNSKNAHTKWTTSTNTVPQ